MYKIVLCRASRYPSPRPRGGSDDRWDRLPSATGLWVSKCDVHPWTMSKSYDIDPALGLVTASFSIPDNVQLISLKVQSLL